MGELRRFYCDNCDFEIYDDDGGFFYVLKSDDELKFVENGLHHENYEVRGIRYKGYCKKCKKIIKTYYIHYDWMKYDENVSKSLLITALKNREKHFLDSLKNLFSYTFDDKGFIVYIKNSSSIDVPIETQFWDEDCSKEEQIQKINVLIDELIQSRKSYFYSNVVNENIIENIEFSSEELFKWINNWRNQTMHCPQCNSNVLPYIYEMDCPLCNEKLILDFDILVD